MQRLIFIIATCAALLGLVYLLQQYIALDAAIGISGILGTAAALAALVGEKPRARKPRIKVSTSYLALKYGLEKVYTNYTFDAILINEGDTPDVLHRVDHKFYNIYFGFIRSLFTCGAKDIATNTGRVLPIEIRPRVSYKVEGFGTIPVKLNLYSRYNHFPEDYILRCRFVFGIAKSVTIRVTSTGQSKKSSLMFTVRELVLRLRTRNKNPFDDT